MKKMDIIISQTLFNKCVRYFRLLVILQRCVQVRQENRHNLAFSVSAVVV